MTICLLGAEAVKHALTSICKTFAHYALGVHMLPPVPLD